MAGTLLSKASHSAELVTRINHADINCEFSPSLWYEDNLPEDYVEKCLRTLMKGIGSYLTGVIGSVPIDLKITLRVYDETASVYPSPMTYGPLYYEGQGQATSESKVEW